MLLATNTVTRHTQPLYIPCRRLCCVGDSGIKSIQPSIHSPTNQPSLSPLKTAVQSPALPASLPLDTLTPLRTSAGAMMIKKCRYSPICSFIHLFPCFSVQK